MNTARTFGDAIRSELDRINFCGKCDQLIPVNARWCSDHNPKNRTVGRETAGERQRRELELQGRGGRETDPWNKASDNGTCCHCGRGSVPEFVLCRRCLDTFDSEGRNRVRASVRRRLEAPEGA